MYTVVDESYDVRIFTTRKSFTRWLSLQATSNGQEQITLKQALDLLDAGFTCYVQEGDQDWNYKLQKHNTK